MTEFANWLLQLVKDLFVSIWDFFLDLAIETASLIFQALVAIISAIPVPSFLSSNSLSLAFASIPPEVWFFAGHFKFAECLAILAAAVAFRLLRKLATLGQW